MDNDKKTLRDPSRRKFVKTAGYVAPAVLTLSAVPSFASAGSGRGSGGSNGGSQNHNGGSRHHGRHNGGWGGSGRHRRRW